MASTIWRIKINSGRPDVTDWDGARAYCREAGLVGLGWGDLPNFTSGVSLDEFSQRWRPRPGGLRQGLG